MYSAGLEFFLRHQNGLTAWRTILAHRKTMTIGEGGSALALVALALLSIVIAAKAYTPEYAFHAYLFSAAGVAAVLPSSTATTNARSKRRR
jgi:hypothetical protein